MVFNSDSSTYVVGVQRAFERALEQELGPVSFTPLYLDFSADNSPSYQESLVNILSQKFASGPIDVVLGQGPEVLAFLLRFRSSLFTGVPIVFTEVSAEDLQQLRLPPEVTGVVADRPSRTIPAALQLLPDTRHIVIVGGSNAADRRDADRLRVSIRTHWPAIDVESLDGMPLEEQRARLGKLPPKSLILAGSYRSGGREAMGGRIIEALSPLANAPMFGFNDYELGAGLVGGDLLQMNTLAVRAARLVARIVNGEAPSTIPPVTLPASELMFNARQLDRWQLDERRLPAGSIVLFRDPTIWSLYKWPILGVTAAFLLQSLFIGGLIIQRRQWRRAQTGLADAEQRYRTVADTSGDWEYWMQPDGSLAYVSPASESMSGYSPDTLVATPGLLSDMVLPEDRAVWSKQMAQARGAPGLSRGQFRIRTRDGETRWIEHVTASVVSPDGRNLGTRVSNRDITERKHAEQELRRAFAEIETLRDRLETDNEYLRERLQPAALAGIVGNSDAMHYVAAKVRQVAPTDTTVLLQGETGVGKGLVAEAIHALSQRKARPLVTVNCAALPPSLIESELFGHERGAFTGAAARRLGRFEIANGGTLFLDEIAELSLELQAKLLRVVQTGEFERLGSNATLKTSVRLIVATHRRLDDEVKAGRFRLDLLYRLNVFPITVPPLRQRREDIPALVTYLLDKHARTVGMAAPQISRAAMRDLESRPWPGNVRELENVLEHGLITSRGTGRFELTPDESGDRGTVRREAAPDTRTLERVEIDHIAGTLARVQWRVEGEGGAADLLGINPSTLRSRMRKYGIRRPSGV
jgi:PAS domain S-box-containing protein